MPRAFFDAQYVYHYFPFNKRVDIQLIWVSHKQLLPYYEKRIQAQSSHITTDPIGVPAGAPNFQHANSSRPCFQASNYTPARSRTIRGRSLRNSTAHRTADDILRLGRGSSPNLPSHGSLDVEIEGYLNDTLAGISNMLYWQVGFEVNNIYQATLANKNMFAYRRTNFVIQLFFSQRLTIFPSKGLPSPVNMFSHLLRRP